MLEVPPAFAPVVGAFAKDRQVTTEEGWGAGNIVLKVKTKIFAMLVRGDFVAKLPKERVDELVSTGKAKHFDAGRGRPMKEWIAVRARKASWVGLAREAHQFVSAPTGPRTRIRARGRAARR